ncbi:hypothetical protein [Romboutsia timonensis]|uniref:hypothetical protein n=1 Tax=Romboutsia timonensis TaxID=1776391 RepID=UPI002A81326D|nr:hypothetical protein [Romboutsia timonensis]MDY3958815.1 hypothetical protein [Romboutsia timonensis]
MDFKLIPLRENNKIKFKKDMQEAFQKGADEGNYTGGEEEEILPESDIDKSLESKGAMAYEAVVDGELIGGAIVCIDEKTQNNHLDFLYVKYGNQSKGIGKKSGMLLSNYIQIRQFGIPALHILRREIYIFMLINVVFI